MIVYQQSKTPTYYAQIYQAGIGGGMDIENDVRDRLEASVGNAGAVLHTP